MNLIRYCPWSSDNDFRRLFFAICSTLDLFEISYKSIGLLFFPNKSILNFVRQLFQLCVSLINFFPHYFYRSLGIPYQHIPVVKLYLMACIVPVLYKVEANIPNDLANNTAGDIMPWHSWLGPAVLISIKVPNTNNILSPNIVIVDSRIHVPFVVVQ